MRMAVVGALVLALVGCSSPDQRAPVRDRSHAAPTVFAYTTYLPARAKYEAVPMAELGVVREGEVIARVPGRFLDSAFWSEDGQHVVATQHGEPDADHLVVYDVSSGRNRTLSFTIPAYSETHPGGGSTIVWWSRPNLLMRADLAQDNPKPEVLRHLSLPFVGATRRGYDDTYIKAQRDGRLVLTRQESPRKPNGGPPSVYVVSPEGDVRSYGPEVGTNGIWNATFSPDGKFLAYSGVRYAPPKEAGGVSNCFHNRIGVLDLATGMTETTDVEGPPDDETESYVKSLWWGSDGTLYASSKSAHCGPGGERTGGKPFAEWTKSGHTWTKVSDEPVLTSIELAAGAKAVLIHSGDPATETGTLYYVPEGGQRARIADNVVDIAARGGSMVGG